MKWQENIHNPNAKARSIVGQGKSTYPKPASLLFGVLALFFALVIISIPVTHASMNSTQHEQSLDFGIQEIGSTSGSQQYTFTNSNTYSATISGISVSGPFRQNNNCSRSIAANGSCAINVYFSPTQVGIAEGFLSFDEVYCDIAANCTRSHTVTLLGKGIPKTLGSIQGKVLLDGQPLPGPMGGVKLNGSGIRQNTDGSGNYGYNDLAQGTYSISVDYDPALYHPDGANSITVNLAESQAAKGVDFHLLSGPAPTTTTIAPTTAPSTTAPVTTAAQTTAASTPNCDSGQSVTGAINIGVCRQSVQVESNGQIKYVLQITVGNGLDNSIDVGNTVEIDIPKGISILSIQSETGNSRTESLNNRVIWNNFGLPSKARATLVLTLEAPPSSAAQTDTILISSIVASAKDTVTGSKYEGRIVSVSALNEKVSQSLKPVSPIPGLPSTGKAEAQTPFNPIIILVFVSLPILLFAGTVFVFRYNRMRNKNR